jgi:hypothetical protein
MKNAPLHLAALALAASALLVGAQAVQAAPAAKPDINGVWLITNYNPMLRAEDGSEPPLLPAAKALYDKRRGQAARGDISFDVTQHCLPAPVPRVMTTPTPIEFLIRDHLVHITTTDRLARRALFSQKLPDDPDPLYLGNSVARWEGRSLVIDTVGFGDNSVLDAVGLPMSGALKVTERFTIVDPNRMDDRFTVNDPKTYSAPWSGIIHYQRLSNFRMGEIVCSERLTSVDVAAFK